MSGRGPVRSSARLSSEVPLPVPAAAPAPAAPGRVGRPAGSAPAAAARRARAAERAREVEDSPRVLRDKCRRLARALRNAKHLVVYTGAGISTAADIPDYRGPHGVWTRLQRGETVGRVEVSRARPTFTHMALTALWARGALKFVVSQNCDGLHLRAGLPRRALAELHGDMYCEVCAACRRVYLRAFDTTTRTARHAHGTRRLCHARACGAELRDSIVHFGERGRAAWPLNWGGALRHAARADVVLCLGSSLKVLRRYPRLWRMQAQPRARPQLYIVNLQWTPKDAAAALKINARCDAVMAQVARRLRLRVPRYRAAADPLLAHAEPLAAPEAHTTRRPPLHELLRSARSSLSSPTSATSPTSLTSPSPSDSDEELPLVRLADRLRDPDLLRAFQVSMHAGEATILLRARHAPPAAPLAPSAPSAPLPPSPLSSATSTAELRRVRIARPIALNGHAPLASGEPGYAGEPREQAPDRADGTLGFGSKLRRLLEYEPHIGPTLVEAKRALSPDERKYAPFTERNGVPKAEPESKSTTIKYEPKPEAKPKVESKAKPKEESASSSGSEDRGGGAGSLAAAIIRRAVLLCRASLYPGLHTIIAPPAQEAQTARAAPAAPEPPRAAPPSEAAECAWCVRRHASPRCLWYGPPRLTALGARAWRRVPAGRVLCACCADPGDPGSGSGVDADADLEVDDAGWYGKGYRKGRRRRR